MAYYLGIDTSNYTTSVAVLDSTQNLIVQQKQLLPVKNGTLGLKQSDAVFSHVKQLGSILQELFAKQQYDISGVGVSVRPRDIEGSYMPCFLVGELVAEAVGAVLHKPVYRLSHQCGHVLAALYSTEQLTLLEKPFLAFHFSGGTSECLYCKPHETHLLEIVLLAASDDLKAGQAIDRVGGMLGLSFPAGMELEALALQSHKSYTCKPCFKGLNPSISGLENQCKDMQRRGELPIDIARYCIDYLMTVVDKMTQNALTLYPDLPIVYAGGVMSNSIIREHITKKYGGFFAQPVFSSDNGAGAAIFAAMKEGKQWQ